MTYEEVKAIRKNPTAEACDIKELQRLIDIAINKQIPKPPEYKVVEKYKVSGKNYWCECGVMFVDFERNGTNYCGNCGQKLKGESE